MIINSLLDTDLYKFTMMQAVFHQYPSAWVKYKFKCRNSNGFPDKMMKNVFLSILKKEIKHLETLKLTDEETKYLLSLRFIKPDFIEFLRTFRLNSEYVKIEDIDNKLSIEIEGPWFSTILFEVPILSIVSELLSREHKNEGDDSFEHNSVIVCKYPNFKFADFGTRRRYSFDYHEEVIKKCIEKLPEQFIGTSNVYFAMKYGIKPIGTMAHEWLQAHQQLGVRVEDSQKKALQSWADEYRGDLGIALTDCITFDSFLRDFDLYFTKLFDGCRQDSGDPYEWCEKLIEHYKKMKIDPKTKYAVFSDGLNLINALNLHKTFTNKINCSFGIGTKLTNNVGFDAPNIVIKMVECNKRPVAKISDSDGKTMCEDEQYINYLKRVFRI